MIHAKTSGTFMVSVYDGYRYIDVTTYSMRDAQHVERALNLTAPPQGTRQPGPCNNPFSDADCRCSPCVDLDDHICTYIDDGECERCTAQFWRNRSLVFGKES